MIITEETEAALLAYVYGELSASEAQAFEERLAADAELRASVDELRAARLLVGRDVALGHAHGHDLPPPHLLDAIVRAEPLERAAEVRDAVRKRAAPPAQGVSTRLATWLFGGGIVTAGAAAALVVMLRGPAHPEDTLVAPTAGLAEHHPAKPTDAAQALPSAPRPTPQEGTNAGAPAAASSSTLREVESASPQDASPQEASPQKSKRMLQGVSDVDVGSTIALGSERAALRGALPEGVTEAATTAAGETASARAQAEPPSPPVPAAADAASIASSNTVGGTGAHDAKDEAMALSPTRAENVAAESDSEPTAPSALRAALEPSAPSTQPSSSEIPLGTREDQPRDMRGPSRKASASGGEASLRRAGVMNAPLATAPFAAARQAERAQLTLATAQRELAARNWISALDAFLLSEELDTRRMLGASPQLGQMRALLGIKRSSEAVTVALRLVQRPVAEVDVVAALLLGAETAERAGKTGHARTLWTRLLDVPAERAKARAALARLEAAEAKEPSPNPASSPAQTSPARTR